MSSYNSGLLYNSKNMYNSGSQFNQKEVSEFISFEDNFLLKSGQKNITDDIIFEDMLAIAETDIFITNKNKIMPFDLTVHRGETSIPLMPEAVEQTTKISGADGEIILNTTYGSMLFEIIGVTDDGLTPEEKEQARQRVKHILHSIKNKTKKFADLTTGKAYSVKYTGLADDTNYPMWVKFNIPLKAAYPYSRNAFRNAKKGICSFVSDTDIEAGFELTINGPYSGNNAISIIMERENAINTPIMIIMPGVSLGVGEKIVLDTGTQTIRKINDVGISTNIMKYYNMEFPKVVSGTNSITSIQGIDPQQVTIEWYNFYI